MKHKNYNVTEQQWMDAGGGDVDLSPCTNCKYKYKYQGQERQDELGLNWDSFKWRNYDYALGRFMSIDPLAEKYPYNSTYAFQENKMGMGRELEGLELVNSEGYKIYNTDPNDGKVGYTNCATPQDKNDGNALKSTPTGTQQFNKLVNMTHPVEVEHNITDAPTSKGEPVMGATITPKENNPEGKSTITIFEKNIDGLVKAVDTSTANGGTALWPLSDGTDLPINGVTKMDILGSTLGEEVEHATDENINLQHNGATREEVEKKPNEVSDQILKDTVGK
jgi:RHS repeat-associated protein